MGGWPRYRYGQSEDIYFTTAAGPFPLHTAGRYHLLLVEKGRFTLRLDGVLRRYAAPCLVAIPEDVAVEWESSPRLAVQIVAFRVAFLNRNITYELIHSGRYEECMEDYGFIPLDIFYKEHGFGNRSLPLSAETLPPLQKLFSQLRLAATNRSDPRWSCRTRLYLNAILELIQQLYEDCSRKNSSPYAIQDPHVWVPLILQKIHRDYPQKLSLATIAAYVHINKTTVSQCFKRLTGYAVTDYIIRYRLKCACYALATTNITLRELAKECGFQQEAYFIRQFTAKMGMTPTVYRQQCVDRRRHDFQQVSVSPLPLDPPPFPL